MHAAVLRELGTPTYDEFDEPVAGDGQVVVEVAAAGVNPIDLALAAGRFYSGPPALPSVCGVEGVGRVAGDGRRVYFGATVAPFGAMAERALVPRDQLFDVPEGLDDGVAVALGAAGLAAWLSLTQRAQLTAGETVLVLGATGIVGQIAVQAAKLLGARRVVAAGRDAGTLARTERLGADATVRLDAEDLAAAFRAAAEGPVDVVIDPIWGAPAVAALATLAPHGRLIQIGQSAGAEAAVPSALLRGKLADIRGHTNIITPVALKAAAYAQLAEHAAAGRIEVDVERLPLRDVAEAWARQQAGAHRKLVLVP